ncbi:MAG: hypothetical protein HW405_746, partial [Candidatus Berkelbacteria bacterium]|nr:hypothetical protein [Candidatus Berkelbacteria bacterium]
MKIKAIYIYLALALWATLLGLSFRLTNFNTTGIAMILVFLTIILAIGGLLLRISHMRIQDFWAKVLYAIGFGLGFFLFINLLAMICGLTLGQLVFANSFFILVLFILSLWEDRREMYEINFTFIKNKTIGEWALIIVSISFGILAVLGVNSQAEKLVGDGGFHLAILEKVVTSKNLAADNLGVTKNATANIVYGFPVWHIFLGFLSKVLNTGIFTVYIRVILPVVILVLIVNFALIKIVFKNRFGAFAGFLAFNIYFLSAGAYFLLVPARSPDSLARILLLPLILGLTVYYLYQAKDKKYLQVILIAILAIILGLIHFTQLIDYVLILGVFALLSLIFNRKKEIFIKLGWLGLALFGLIVPYLFIFQFENFRQFFANNALAFRADTFTNKSFHDLGNFYLYTVFTLPLVVLFGQKNKRLVFLLAIPLTLMLVSWETFHLRVIFL